MTEETTQTPLNITDVETIITDIENKKAKQSRECFKKYYNTEHGRAKTLLRYYNNTRIKEKDPIIKQLLLLEVDPVEKYNLIMIHKHFKKLK